MSKSINKKGGFALYAILNGLFILISIFIMVISLPIFPYMPSHESGINSVFLIYTALWIPVTILGCFVVANALITKRLSKGLLVLLCLMILYIPVVFLFAYIIGAGETLLIVLYLIFIISTVTYTVFFIHHLINGIKSFKSEKREEDEEQKQ